MSNLAPLTTISNLETVSQLSTIEILTRIRRGRAWLENHFEPTCVEWGRNYDHERFTRNLNFYEKLVDEAEKRGFKEEDGWKFELSGLQYHQMTEDEILLTMFPGRSAMLTRRV